MNVITSQYRVWTGFVQANKKRCLRLLNLSVPESLMWKNPLTQLQIENEGCRNFIYTDYGC